MNLASIAIDVILPVILMASAGFALEKWQAVSNRQIAKITLYVFSPCLVFASLAKSTVSAGEMGQIALFAICSMAVLGLVASLTARLGRYDRSSESAHLLSTLFMNSGNYGLPVILLAFGQNGLERAVIFMVAQSMLVNTVAVYIAARSNLGTGAALLSALKMPQVYAAALGLGMHFGGIAVPTQLYTATKMLGDAAIPAMVLVLGIQLANSAHITNLGRVGLASLTRLGVAPVIALLLAPVIGLEGLTAKVIIVEAAMPTAVAALVLAIEFDAKPEFVSSTVLVSTIASVGTLSLLLMFLTGT
ncbi:MAG: AEC family transporter [Dehalococcoidia bacterium]|nr:AEC family transporter [Dehalococcoidia bacterium]